jgi:hypothetical protein
MGYIVERKGKAVKKPCDHARKEPVESYYSDTEWCPDCGAVRGTDGNFGPGSRMLDWQIPRLDGGGLPPLRALQRATSALATSANDARNFAQGDAMVEESAEDLDEVRTWLEGSLLGLAREPTRELIDVRRPGYIRLMDKPTDTPPGTLMSEAEQLANWFSYHPPTAQQAESYERIRAAAKVFAEVLCRECPNSADRSAAVRKLREAVYTANASIACAGR